ncbi:MAG: hypothetical protein ACHP79_11030, partial [Terriglobales bacterium]
MLMTRDLRSLVTKVLLLLGVLATVPAAAQSDPAAPAARSAVAVYRDLLNPTLNTVDVYQIRGVSVDREDLHVSLSDGMIGLMQSVEGHVTGAIFEGQGEVLLIAPDRAERTSLALFTGSAVLEQKFGSAYFRFFDDKLVEELRAGLRKAEPAEVQEFVARWQQPARDLAQADGLHILQAMTNRRETAATFLHVRLGGTALGIFDLFYDGSAREQISVAQASVNQHGAYVDTWASFPQRSARRAGAGSPPRPQLDFSDYQIRSRIDPPTDLSAEAEFTILPHIAGQRMVILELSRQLRVSEARLNGQAVEFIQNEAVTGSNLARRGDDLVGLVFPQAME